MSACGAGWVWGLLESEEKQGRVSGDAEAEVEEVVVTGTLIHGVLDMMNADQTIDTLRWAVPIHPTVSELLPTVLLDLKREGEPGRCSGRLGRKPPSAAGPTPSGTSPIPAQELEFAPAGAVPRTSPTT